MDPIARAARLHRLLAIVGVPTIVGGVGFIALAVSQGALALTWESLLPYAVGILLITAGVLSMRSGTHPAFVLMTLDLVGLAVAGYLSAVELANQLPYCSVLHGCEQVAQSEYSRINGIPVAVFGVILSVTLIVLAFAWWRTGSTLLLGTHYGLSLVGTLFEIRFLWIQAFLIMAVCLWCLTYGISLVLRFVVALIVWLHQPRDDYEDELA